jgi:hypothetical protein
MVLSRLRAKAQNWDFIHVRQLKLTAKDSKALNSAFANENTILCRHIYVTDMRHSLFYRALAQPIC